MSDGFYLIYQKWADGLGVDLTFRSKVLREFQRDAGKLNGIPVDFWLYAIATHPKDVAIDVYLSQ